MGNPLGGGCLGGEPMLRGAGCLRGSGGLLMDSGNSILPDKEQNKYILASLHKVIEKSCGAHYFNFITVALVATVASWVYRTGVFLLVCVLFRLTCELQILRFEGIHPMFDVEARAAAAEIFAEHRRIRTQLLATSHRYRVFIICCLVTITVSQLGALLVVLSSGDAKSFSNTGDLLVGSAVQLSGFFMCLFGAARITHRAQRIVSIASQWHMSMVAMHHGKSPPDSTPASDVDASRVSGSSAAVSQAEPGWACSYKSRQALVTYLRHNGGGITLFGFTLDRGLLHTIFVFEMTLVLWILSKVVVLQ
ncbi:hypothetical protein C2845_PM13G22550 [Panicum miliaceum]|uniref:Uncharacterized protein n=1 Tax=Panicum miliaceum TaxID=4540 RepID=A0A3L6RIG1_PANMI|nr:hypothetical protein C2845_PM13G22550 [Panicum miliaceum]